MNRKEISRTELIERLVENTGMSQRDVEELLDALVERIKRAVGIEREIHVPELIKFIEHNLSDYSSRNQKTVVEFSHGFSRVVDSEIRVDRKLVVSSLPGDPSTPGADLAPLTISPGLGGDVIIGGGD